jgi:hypothetical protein
LQHCVRRVNAGCDQLLELLGGHRFSLKLFGRHLPLILLHGHVELVLLLLHGELTVGLVLGNLELVLLDGSVGIKLLLGLLESSLLHLKLIGHLFALDAKALASFGCGGEALWCYIQPWR